MQGKGKKVRLTGRMCVRDPRYLGEGESRAPTLTRSDAVPPKPGTRNRAVGAQGGGRVVGTLEQGFPYGS